MSQVQAFAAVPANLTQPIYIRIILPPNGDFNSAYLHIMWGKGSYFIYRNDKRAVNA
jgi:hypothetical protein